MRADCDRWLRFLSAAALVVVASVGVQLGGGEFVMQVPTSPRLVDISAEVRANCTASAERTLPDGVPLKVLYAPGFERAANEALDLMEKVHDALASELGFTFRTGSRLYVAQLSSYPASFKTIDKAPGTPGWVFLRSGGSDAEVSQRIQEEVYGTLPHEWAHSIFNERFGANARLLQSRWISDGLASYAEYLVQGRLAPEVFDQWRSYYLPFFSLDEASLDTLLRWENAREIPLDKPLHEVNRYGAALGLFLRVGATGGPNAVLSLLDLLKDRRKVREEEVEAALVKVTGHTYEELARMSPDEREAAYREALAALDGPGRWRRLYGLAVLDKFHDRIDQWRGRVEPLVNGAEIEEMVRAKAKGLIGEAPTDHP